MKILDDVQMYSIKKEFEKQGAYTYLEIARRIGLSHTYVTNVFNGKKPFTKRFKHVCSLVLNGYWETIKPKVTYTIDNLTL